MSPIVVRTRAKRRILQPFAVGLNAVGTAALLWLDAQKSLALKNNNESVDTPFNDGSDRPLHSNKSGAHSEPLDATKSNEKDIADADTNSNLPVTDVDSGSSKPPAVDANADFQGRDVLVVGSSTPPQILAGPAPTKLVLDAITQGSFGGKQFTDSTAAASLFVSEPNWIIPTGAVTNPGGTLQIDTLAPTVTSVVSSGADTVTPMVTVSIDNHDVNVAQGTGTVTFAFSEATSDFTLAATTATGGVLSNLATSDGGLTYTATFMANAGTFPTPR